jgi:hypothetical protein
MSLRSTAAELLSYDVHHNGYDGILKHYSAPGSDLAEHLADMADEIEEASC